jgi:phage portal protein BeeE
VPQLLDQLREQRATARREGDEILTRAAAEGRDLTAEELTGYQAHRDGEDRPLPALPPILRTPSAGWSLPEFLYAALQSLLLRGNAYGLIVDRAGAGLLPSQVELLAYERVGVQVDGASSTGSTAKRSTQPPSGT